MGQQTCAGHSVFACRHGVEGDRLHGRFDSAVCHLCALFACTRVTPRVPFCVWPRTLQVRCARILQRCARTFHVRCARILRLLCVRTLYVLCARTLYVLCVALLET